MKRTWQALDRERLDHDSRVFEHSLMQSPVFQEMVQLLREAKDYHEKQGPAKKFGLFQRVRKFFQGSEPIGEKDKK